MNFFLLFFEDDRPMEEERKSVRFDLQKVAIQTAVTKFNDSEDEEEEDEMEESRPEEHSGGISAMIAARRAAAVLSLQQVLNRRGGAGFQLGAPFAERPDVDPKNSKIVGRRFVVENVSEKEHMQQQEDRSFDNDEDYVPNRFNIRNIDLVSKSDSEKSTPRSSGDSRSSMLDDLRKSKEVMLENMRKSELRTKVDENRPEGQSLWSLKMLHSIELSKEAKSPSFENTPMSLEFVKNSMLKEDEQELRKFKQELDIKLNEIKQQLEDKYNEEKRMLEKSLEERLNELRKEMSMKEDQEIQKLISDMGDARTENLKKVRSELEICYEKERQDILVNLKSELDQRKHELLELRSQEISKLESEHEKELEDERQAKISEIEIFKQHGERTENLKKELDKEFDNLRAELRAQQREKITKITEDHEKCLADILRDFRVDVSII